MDRYVGGFLAVLIILGALGAGVVALINVLSPPWAPAPGTPIYGYRVLATFPHDPNAFTEGLVYFQGYLYEGTGLNGRSSIRQQNLTSGEVLRSVALPEQYFGEGVTILGERVYQLTWQSNVGFVYDLNFTPVRNFSYVTEGWGLTNNGSHLIMSDGTANLYFLDPGNLTVVEYVQVRDGTSPVTQLNELEYVNGEVWANVWKTDLVARISPATGSVLGWIDISGLLSPAERLRPVDVLNGIAYDAASDRLLVTGKLWPTIFQIELVP
jgi:glutamine cyclotransferase